MAEILFSGAAGAAVSLGGRLTLATAQQTKETILSALTVDGSVELLLEEAAEFDISFVQLLEAARIFAHRRGGSGLVTAVSEPGLAAFDAVLFDGDAPALITLGYEMARRSGPIIPIHVARPNGDYPLEWLVQERALSTNTTAAGGNANLMMIG